MYYLTKKEKSFYSIKLYKGEIKNSQREGFGIQLFPNGCLYLGFWHKNQASGQGLFILKDSTLYKGTYSQNFITQGKIKYFNSATYEGNFDKTPQERFKNGTFTFKSGPKYTGEWYEGIPTNGYMTFMNKKIGEIPREKNITFMNGDMGVFLSSENKLLYEGGLENGVFEGKGIVYCTFGQYKMGGFRQGVGEGDYYKMSVNWGFVESGSVRDGVKVAGVKKMFNNGFYLSYEMGKLEKATVTFPFLNRDYFKGKVVLDVEDSFSIVLSKGVYYKFVEDNKFRGIEIFDVSNVLELQIATDVRNVSFEFSFNEFVKKKKFLKEMNDFMEYLYKNNISFPEELLPDCLKIKKEENINIRISEIDLDLERSMIDKSVREKYIKEIKNRSKTRPKPRFGNLNNPDKKISLIQRKKTGLRFTRSISPFQIRKSKVNDKKYLNFNKISSNLLKSTTMTSKKSSKKSLSKTVSKNKKLIKSLKIVKPKQNYYNPLQISKKKFFIKEENIDFFQGKIIKGLKQGKGKLITNEDIIYEGNFIDNIIQGKGKMIYNNYKYEGNFKNGILEGSGNFVLKDKKYEGKFVNGIFFSKLIIVDKTIIIFFKKSLDRDLKSGEVIIFFQNFYKVHCKILIGKIEEGKCIIEDPYLNKWKGNIKKSKKILKAFCHKLGKRGYFELNVLNGIVKIVSK